MMVAMISLYLSLFWLKNHTNRALKSRVLLSGSQCGLYFSIAPSFSDWWCQWCPILSVKRGHFLWWMSLCWEQEVNCTRTDVLYFFVVFFCEEVWMWPVSVSWLFHPVLMCLPVSVFLCHSVTLPLCLRLLSVRPWSSLLCLPVCSRTLETFFWAEQGRMGSGFWETHPP